MSQQHVLGDFPHVSLVDLQPQVIDQVRRRVVPGDDRDGKRRENRVAAIANSQLDAVSEIRVHPAV